MGLVVLFQASIVLRAALFASSTSSCREAQNAACVQLCYDDIAARPCDGPMIARYSGPGDDKWRCYSPSTLDEDQENYVSGDCYCTREDELVDVEEFCEENITTVFSKNFDGDHCYRIPTIIRLTSGKLLAFAEQRGSDCSDNGENNLVLRQSSDNGITWGNIITIENGNGSPLSNPNPVEVRFPNGTYAVLFHYDTMNNPSIDKHGANMQRWSFDDGTTWSEPEDITSFMPENYEGCMPGPSVGVQQVSQPGVNKQHRTTKSDRDTTLDSNVAETIYFSCHESSSAFLYYSSDMGQTWKYSEPIAGLNECSIALLPNRSVAMNCRSGDRRQLTFSEEGELLMGPVQPTGLVDPGCQGSIVSQPNSPSPGTLFLSNDATTSGRYNMTVKRSDDGGISWNEGLLVWANRTGYSQLVAWNDDDEEHSAHTGTTTTTTLGLLFEVGLESKYQAIGFTTVRIED